MSSYEREYLVLEVLAVWPCGDDHAPNLVNLAVELPRGYELRELSVRGRDGWGGGRGSEPAMHRAYATEPQQLLLNVHCASDDAKAGCCY